MDCLWRHKARVDQQQQQQQEKVQQPPQLRLPSVSSMTMAVDGASSLQVKSEATLLNQSIRSIQTASTDSQLLDLMNMHHSSINLCNVNPLSKTGKRMEVMSMLGVTLVPIVMLMTLLGYMLGTSLTEYSGETAVRETVEVSISLGDVIHALQKERDRSVLYRSSIGPDTKSRLIEQYALTDRILDEFTDPNIWKYGSRNQQFLKSKHAFQKYLQAHRYKLDIESFTVKREVDFYSDLVNYFTGWILNAIQDVGSGSVWKQLVALQEVIRCTEYYGRERAYGAVYFEKNGFTSVDDALQFIDAQDAANMTLFAARSYSDRAEQVYQETVADKEIFQETIREYRYTIRYDPYGRNLSVDSHSDTTGMWYDNMTLYIDALHVMQKTLSRVISTKMAANQVNGQTIQVVFGVLLLAVLFICPVILHEVYKLTRDIQKYSDSLTDKTKALNKENQRSDMLLHSMLPKSVVAQLKNNEQVSAESYSKVTILFSDIVGFTNICAMSSPYQVVNMLDALYTTFDKCIQTFDVYKIETIGDAYMVASGLPKRNGIQHAGEICSMSLRLLEIIRTLRIPHMPNNKYRLRIGCHSGPVVAGIVGNRMPRYCLFGESVCIASSMESTGMAGRVHISHATNELLQELGGFQTDLRSDCNNIFGDMPTYWLMDSEGIDLSGMISRSTTSSTDSLEYDLEDNPPTSRAKAKDVHIVSVKFEDANN